MIGLLIRHGHAEPVGKWLAGRQRGIPLSDRGRQEAARLTHALTWAPLTAVYTSPLERAMETAWPIAADHGIRACVRSALTDIDFGSWTGKSLDQLAGDAEWRQFNQARAGACPPQGESLVEVQRRMVDELMALATCHAAETIAIIGHAEPIRCALAAFNGHSLDEITAIEIDPGHVSPIGVTGRLRRVLGVNVHPNEITV